jgi:cytochrome c553
MKRLRLLSLALIATVAAAWTLPAWAGNCAAGKSKYVTNCSGCHGSTPNAQAQLGSNPAVILTQMTDSTAPGYPSMNVLYPGTVNDTDIDDIAMYLFYFPSACPVSSPILQASPAPVAFGSVTVGATSATTTVTITNAGSAAATGVGFSNSNATEFIVSANTCTATINAGANCSLKFAFKPSASGSRSGTLTVNRSGGAGVGIGMSGTGSAVATPGQLSMPASMSFASQAVSTTSAASSVTITNIGGTAVSVSSVSSSNPSEFTIASSTCGTVGTGGSCAIGVTFKPGGGGTRSGAISVVSSGVGSPQAISASGTGTTAGSSPTVPVVEYYNAVLDHYFITPVSAEVGLLDTKSAPFQDWSRTGYQFNGYANATAPAGSVAICRFFNSTFAPKSSHFYAPHGLGCEATLASFPDWKLEDDKLFNTMLPDASGACPAGTIPVYRLYNNGMGGAPNHRFVTSLAERQNMISKGYVPEGNGIGVGMCAAQ